MKPVLRPHVPGRNGSGTIRQRRRPQLQRVQGRDRPVWEGMEAEPEAEDGKECGYFSQKI